jgi:hypothetical protein
MRPVEALVPLSRQRRAPPGSRGSCSGRIVKSDQMSRCCPFGPGRLAGMRLARSRQSDADPIQGRAYATANPRVKPTRCSWPVLACMDID